MFMKKTNKKMFFAYDDKKTLPVFLMFLAGLFIVILVKFNEDKFIVIMSVILIFLSLYGMIMILGTGIHCNARKKVITIIDSLWFRKIRFNDIQYVVLKQIKKKRKKSLFPYFCEMPFSKWFHEPTCVYNNGEIFVVEIHLKTGAIEKTYYTWLFQCKSKKRVAKQQQKLEKFVTEINNMFRRK